MKEGCWGARAILGWETYKCQSWWANLRVNATYAALFPVTVPAGLLVWPCCEQGGGKDVAGMQRASCAIPGLHKWKLEGQRELDRSSGREVAAGTAEELQKHFALFPAEMGTGEEGWIWVGSRLSKGLHYWLNFFHTKTLQNLGKEEQVCHEKNPTSSCGQTTKRRCLQSH